MDVSLLEDALRRSSSSLNTGHPTRTLHITASEQSLLRDNATPTSMIISAEELSSRPRSNPRSRTPMRFESPLNNDAFRRRAVSPSPVPEEPPRVTIRPLAASPLHERGHMRRHGNLTQREQQPSRSSKQGKPSQRKIRRWNNEHFVDLATEISSSSTRGAATAEVLIKAHRDAHLYRPIYDPKEHCRSEAVVRFMNSNEMKGVREQFFEGEGPTPLVPMSRSSVSNRSSKEAHTANDMLNRIDPRLRRLVVRACRNSYAASKVAGYFEDFVLRSFATTTASKKTKNVGSENWWRDIVLECPTVTQRKDNGRYSAHFFFHATAPTGGFHRLLLQAVCQFHGLHAVSRMEDNFLQQGKESCGARVLVVSGAIIASPVSSFRLLALLDADTSTIINPKEKEIERSMHHRSSIECSQQTSHEHDLEYVIVEKP